MVSPSAKTISPRSANALKNLEDAVGGRDGLIDTLVLAELTDKQQHLVRMMTDPARAGDSLAKICKDANIKPNELIEMYRKASFAKAQAIAIGKAADAIPRVVADIAEKSVDRTITCPVCQGAKVDSDNKKCTNCFGNGTLVRESELDRQKTLLDMLGLGQKGGGGISIINQNQQINQGNVGSLFSSFVKATDKAAYDVAPPVIDAEVKEVDGR